jgi:carboxylesterase type B
LNLSITCPRSVLEQGSLEKLPVLVFIHGGAFVGGSQSIQLAGREIYDGTHLVRASIARNQPTLVVTCNYRVGPLGFLASKELSDFNKEHGEPIGNYGLHDQRQALEWCHKFIAGFGGDAANVTIQGTSAGGSSAHYLSIFPDRKFKRAILASGTLTGIGPMSMDYQQKNFHAYVSRHSRQQTKSSTSVELLQSIPVEEMIKPVSDGISHPLIDGEWILGMTMQDVTKIYTHSTAPDLMIGACDFEVSFLIQLSVVFSSRSLGRSNPAPSHGRHGVAKARIGLQDARESFRPRILERDDRQTRRLSKCACYHHRRIRPHLIIGKSFHCDACMGRHVS